MSTGLKDAGYTYVNLDDCWMDRFRNNVTGALVGMSLIYIILFSVAVVVRVYWGAYNFLAALRRCDGKSVGFTR